MDLGLWNGKMFAELRTLVISLKHWAPGTCFKLGLQGTPAKIAAGQPTWIHTLSKNCGVAVAKSNLEGWSLSILPAQKLEKLEERGEKTI